MVNLLKGNKTKILISFIFLSLCNISFANEFNKKFAVGINAGWGSAYGWGPELKYMPKDYLDINFGLGLNFSGPKIGIGSRYYTAPEKSTSPFFGFTFVHSYDAGELTVTKNNRSATYKFESNNIFHINTGLRFIFDKNLSVLIKAGYGFALKNNDAIYKSGDQSDDIKNMANLISPGGLELSLSLFF